jgi:hypothetical protein
MLLLDRILTHIVNHLSNTSYHFQYLYYPGGNETGAKPNLITCITEIFLSALCQEDQPVLKTRKYNICRGRSNDDCSKHSHIHATSRKSALTVHCTVDYLSHDYLLSYCMVDYSCIPQEDHRAQGQLDIN